MKALVISGLNLNGPRAVDNTPILIVHADIIPFEHPLDTSMCVPMQQS